MKTIVILMLGLLLLASATNAWIIPGQTYSNGNGCMLNYDSRYSGSFSMSYTVDLRQAKTVNDLFNHIQGDWTYNIPAISKVSLANEAYSGLVMMNWRQKGFGTAPGWDEYVFYVEANRTYSHDSRLDEYDAVYVDGIWVTPAGGYTAVKQNGILPKGKVYDIAFFFKYVDGVNDIAYMTVDGKYQMDALGRPLGVRCATGPTGPSKIQTEYDAWGDGWDFGTSIQGDITVGHTARAAVKLGDYDQTKLAGIPVTVDITDIDHPQTPVRTVNTTLKEDGNFEIAGVEPGKYSMGIKPSHWLRKVIGPVNVPNSDMSFMIR